MKSNVVDSTCFCIDKLPEMKLIGYIDIIDKTRNRLELIVDSDE